MKRAVLGTAGHIDHGKTLLTKALTGVDTDRLAEEKARGITIELGFAPLKLKDGTLVSIVDVPGHERFVRTMMAGAAGIDCVLLTVAADDGVMPQTREHLDIIRLLQVQTGLPVITKCDLADEARLNEVEEQIGELVRGTCLEGRPACRVSALTGEGIEELKERIFSMVEGIRERSGERPARMEVDRVFPVEGFGTVATGTLTEGTLVPGREIELYPERIPGIVRSLQQHGRNEEKAEAGTRTAVSFSRLAKGYPLRGQTLAEPGSLAVTDVLTVQISVTDSCPWTIWNSSKMHFFHGTEETVCRLRLLDADRLRAGETGYAQLQMPRPVAVRLGDRFLLRFFSPVLTVAGGTVLAFSDRRLRRNRPEVTERLTRLASPELTERLDQLITDAGLEGTDAEGLRLLTGCAPEEFRRAEQALTDAGLLVKLPDGCLISADVEKRALEAGLAVLDRYHEDYPLMRGMPQNRWRQAVGGTRPDPLGAGTGRPHGIRAGIHAGAQDHAAEDPPLLPGGMDEGSGPEGDGRKVRRTGTALSADDAASPGGREPGEPVAALRRAPGSLRRGAGTLPPAVPGAGRRHPGRIPHRRGDLQEILPAVSGILGPYRPVPEDRGCPRSDGTGEGMTDRRPGACRAGPLDFARTPGTMGENE